MSKFIEVFIVLAIALPLMLSIPMAYAATNPTPPVEDGPGGRTSGGSR